MWNKFSVCDIVIVISSKVRYFCNILLQCFLNFQSSGKYFSKKNGKKDVWSMN